MTKNYVLIHYKNKRPLKKYYDTASKAFFDHDDCIYVELFNKNGVRLASFPF